MAKYQTDFPPFGVTADILVFTLRDDQHDMEVLLIERAGEPFEGMWAIPGGFIDKDGKDKSIQDTAYRELEEETGIRKKDGDLLQ
jgi:8-oxo-dGTP diphosphatase